MTKNTTHKPKTNCGCNLCGRGREYYRIIDKLPKEEREFMHKFYEYILCLETDNAVYEYNERKAKS